ncbi:hypothetical protein DFH09DRAFT_1100743 [Mycena vulgaris]|nr:hypothetical protein DFH09DRAFT_1100743 [Mycena vulgaris]
MYSGLLPDWVWVALLPDWAWVALLPDWACPEEFPFLVWVDRIAYLGRSLVEKSPVWAWVWVEDCNLFGRGPQELPVWVWVWGRHVRWPSDLDCKLQTPGYFGWFTSQIQAQCRNKDLLTERSMGRWAVSQLGQQSELSACRNLRVLVKVMHRPLVFGYLAFIAAAQLQLNTC